MSERVSLRQAAALVGIKRRALYYWRARGWIEFDGTGHSKTVKVDDLLFAQRTYKDGRHGRRVLAAVLVATLVLPTTTFAQEVNRAADWVSWGTAVVNPTWGVVEALRGERRACHLGQLALSAGVGMGTAFTAQRFIRSPRPCCAGNGMPSAHATASMLGFAQPSPARGFSWRMTIGLGSAWSTAGLRVGAHRHTSSQVLVGLLLGGGSELLGQLIRCD